MGSINDPENYRHDKWNYEQEKKEKAAIMEACQTNLGDNKMYSMLMKDYLRCTYKFIG